MVKKYTWTVDVDGGDFGGRTNSSLGIRYGLPKILEIFRDRGIKALFFISTELLKFHQSDLEQIVREGHEIGSHGHFHIDYKNDRRAKDDMEISRLLIQKLSGKEYPHYRSPHFSYQTEDIYSDPFNHVSLLKYTWFNQSIPKSPIFYIHPFDIVYADNAPNLYCQILYSRPKEVLKNFRKLTENFK